MLAEILANPVAWPLWAVFVFAATMYPLGFMLPGCVCCGAGNCTQCGVLESPYQSNQPAYGRMCCTGSIASTVTLRVTSVGPPPPVVVFRGTGASYSRVSATFNCSAMDGDYVLPLVRSVFANQGFCEWSVDTYPTCATQLRATLIPLSYDPTLGTAVAFPSWFLSLERFERTIPGSFRFQTCSGHPGIESCNTGTTLTAQNWLALYSGPNAPGGLPRPQIRLEEQRCNPAGITLATNHRFVVNQHCASGFTFGTNDTGCEFRMELV
jgi:hypothetical protein